MYTINSMNFSFVKDSIHVLNDDDSVSSEEIG